MEPEVLSDEQMEWEARRVGTAFGVAQWERVTDEILDYKTWFSGMNAGHRVRWEVSDQSTVEVHILDMSTQSSIGAHIWLKEDHFNVDRRQALAQQHEIMARGIYCLSLEDEGGFALEENVPFFVAQFQNNSPQRGEIGKDLLAAMEGVSKIVSGQAEYVQKVRKGIDLMRKPPGLGGLRSLSPCGSLRRDGHAL